MTGIERIITDFVFASLWQIGLILPVTLLVDRILLSRTRAAVRHVHWLIASLASTRWRSGSGPWRARAGVPRRGSSPSDWEPRPLFWRGPAWPWSPPAA